MGYGCAASIIDSACDNLRRISMSLLGLGRDEILGSPGIDGSSSKSWSILTYPKRHEPSLDIW